MSRIWTVITINGGRVQRHEFHASYDPGVAECTFRDSHPEDGLVAMMPGNMSECRTFDLVTPLAGDDIGTIDPFSMDGLVGNG
jgi:hypothetical protein